MICLRSLEMKAKMNKVILMGRLTRDPDIRLTQGEKSTTIASYTLAVDRRFKRDGGPTADFINCKAFGKNGEFVEKYLKKGVKIAVEGEIITGSYEKDGARIYTTEVHVSSHEFCESRASSEANSSSASSDQPKPDSDGFLNVPDGIDEELPFN